MGVLVLLLLVVVPVVEIAVFIEVGGTIGLANTIAVVVVTAIAGAYLLRRQGISTLLRIQEKLEANRIPLRQLFDGVCLAVAGALLLTPGFVTDGFGFLLFLPPFRALLAGYLARVMAARGHVVVTPGHPPPGGGGPGPVIDGDYEEVAEPPPGDDRRLPR